MTRRPKLPAVIVTTILFTITSLYRGAHAQSPIVGGPEDSRIRCVTADTCPAPVLSTGQDSRCVKAACIRNICTTKILAGASLGYQSPGSLSCFLEPMVCTQTGTVAVDQAPSKRLARNEGQTCASSLPVPSCSIARCRGGQCQIENNDGAVCSNASLTVCQKGVCQGGLCTATGDRKRRGVECAPPKTNGCASTVYRCSNVGSCEPTDIVADGKECAPKIGFNSNSASLPTSFRNSMIGGAPTSGYSCTSSCKLEYCGDSIIQATLGEECDNSATTKPNTVCSKCKVACAPGMTADKYGTCCPDSRKDVAGSSGTCCPDWKTPGCSSCDGCKGCPTARCRFGGPYGWPMAHLGPDCSGGWQVSAGCGSCRLDFGHGAKLWKIGLHANTHVVGNLPCYGRTDIQFCSDPGKSGWIYSTDPAGERLTYGEERTKVPCECVNGAIVCSPSEPYPPRCLSKPVRLTHRYKISAAFGSGSNDSVGVLYSHNEIYEVCRGALGAASVSDVVPYDGVPGIFASPGNNTIFRFAGGPTSERISRNAAEAGNPSHIAAISCRCM